MGYLELSSLTVAQPFGNKSGQHSLNQTWAFPDGDAHRKPRALGGDVCIDLPVMHLFVTCK